MCDLIVTEDGGARYYEELPVDYFRETSFGAAANAFAITLEYGPNHDQFDPFDISVGRISQADAEQAAKGRYLHPVVRHYAFGVLVAEHHVTENLENEWTSEAIHCQPLQAFFERQLAAGVGMPAVSA
jgi:hypothetical protein